VIISSPALSPKQTPHDPPDQVLRDPGDRIDDGGRSFNKCRGMQAEVWDDPDGPRPAGNRPPASCPQRPPPAPPLAQPHTRVWGEDPLLCPRCKGLMKVRDTLTRPEEIEFFLRLHGMWEGVLDIPPPPAPPYDIETMEPIRVPALFRRAQQEDSETLDASRIPCQTPELPLDDERILVLDGDPLPPDESPTPSNPSLPFEALAERGAPRRHESRPPKRKLPAISDRPEWLQKRKTLTDPCYDSNGFASTPRRRWARPSSRTSRPMPRWSR